MKVLRRGPLRDRRFTRLWIARFVSNVGNGMAPTALAFGVLGIPGATAKDLGLVLAAHAIPLALLMPIGGVVADRVSRARVIAVSDLILGVLIVFEGWLFITGSASVPALVVINAVAGALNSLWWPAFPGLVPALVEDGELQMGNSLIAVASNVGFIGGSALAGALVAGFGAGTAIVVDGVSFVLAGGLVYGLRHATPPREGAATESVLRDLREGWSTFISFRWLWVLVAVFALINAVFRGAVEVGGPVLMKESFDGPTTWALLQTAQGVGFLAGAAVAARLRPRRPLVFLLLASVAFPAGMLALAVPVAVPGLAVAFFLLGACMDLWGVTWGTVMQSNIPRDLLSRATSFDALGSMALGPVGLAIAGPVIAAFGIPATMTAAAIVTVVLLAVGLADREVRRLPWKDAAPELG